MSACQCPDGTCLASADGKAIGRVSVISDQRCRAAGVGDVTSAARGSAARYNAGKPDLALIPLRLIAGAYPSSLVTGALSNLGHWQETGDCAWLYQCLRHLGPGGWGECADVFTYGAAKYTAWNWAKGFPWSNPLASAARHLLAMLEGETIDSESKLPHRGHVFCNVVMLLTFQTTYPEGDDRPRLLVPSPELLRSNET